MGKEHSSENEIRKKLVNLYNMDEFTVTDISGEIHHFKPVNLIHLEDTEGNELETMVLDAFDLNRNRMTRIYEEDVESIFNEMD